MADSHSGSSPPPLSVQDKPEDSARLKSPALTEDAPSNSVAPPLPPPTSVTAKKRKRDSKSQHPRRSWCDEAQWEFLTSLLPVYVQHVQAHDNASLVAFYETTLGEWKDKNWTWEEMGATRKPIRAPGDDDEKYGRKAKERAKTALINWFKNRSKHAVRPSSGNRLLASFLKERPTKALSPVAAYLRLYYEERNMKTVIDERYAEHLKSIKEGEIKTSLVAFRMQVAAELLKREPVQVQEEIKRYCKSTKASDYDERDDFKDYPAEEAMRLGAALKASRIAASLPQIANTILDITFQQTRFRGLIAFVGPDFQDTGNDAHLYVCSRGSTSDNKLSIEGFSRHYEPFVRSLQAWGQQCLTTEDKDFYSLRPRVPPLKGANAMQETPPSDGVVTMSSSASIKHPENEKKTNKSEVDVSSSSGDDSSCESSESDGEDNGDTASRPGVAIADKMLRPDYAKLAAMGAEFRTFSREPESQEASHPASIANASYDANVFAAAIRQPSPSITNPFPLNPERSPPAAPHIDPSLLNPDLYPSAAPQTTESTRPLTAQVPQIPPPSCPPALTSLVSEKENLQAPTAVVTTVVNNAGNSVLGPSRSVNKPAAAKETKSKSPKKAGRKAKSTAVRKQPVVNVPVGDPAWSTEAGAVLRQNLRGLNACEAVERWQCLEECLAFPDSTKAADSLPSLKAAPDCLQQFISGGRLPDFKPARDADAVLIQFKTFWTMLQPIDRQASGVWPPPKNGTQAQDWSKLKKGGPNGFYLILQIMSFWSTMAWYADERRAFEEAMEDVNWVLGEILKDANGGTVLGKRRRARA